MGLQLSHFVIHFNIYQSVSVFIYRDESNFLCHALWLQLNCNIFCYYTALLAEGAGLRHIKVTDNLNLFTLSVKLNLTL